MKHEYLSKQCSTLSVITIRKFHNWNSIDKIVSLEFSVSFSINRPVEKALTEQQVSRMAF